MTECVPDFEFAPQGTFTIGDAARAAKKNYTSHFGGKWCMPQDATSTVLCTD